MQNLNHFPDFRKITPSALVPNKIQTFLSGEPCGPKPGDRRVKRSTIHDVAAPAGARGDLGTGTAVPVGRDRPQGI